MSHTLHFRIVPQHAYALIPVMEKLNHAGTDQLRKGRQSIPGAKYFITVCTENRQPGLGATKIRRTVLDALRELHRAGDLALHCGTIMPDHAHTVFTLGHRLTLSQTQAKFKRLTNDALAEAHLIWQENYHDHRIRQGTLVEPFARYTFLNPYRKRLLTCEESWAGWILNQHYQPEFTEHLIGGIHPPPEWLDNTESIENLIEQDLFDEAAD